MAQDLADAIAQMYEKGRYNEMLLFVETCEASTMWKRVYSPSVLGMASSKLGDARTVSDAQHLSPYVLDCTPRYTHNRCSHVKVLARSCDHGRFEDGGLHSILFSKMICTLSIKQ
eukprot:scaffold159752_cov28-Prasinocladus_malaysianus.AAC.1